MLPEKKLFYQLPKTAMSLADLQQLGRELWHSGMTKAELLRRLDAHGIFVPLKIRYGLLSLNELKEIAGNLEIPLGKAKSKSQVVHLLSEADLPALVEQAGGKNLRKTELLDLLYKNGLLDTRLHEMYDLSFHDLLKIAKESTLPSAVKITEEELLKQSTFAKQLKKSDSDFFKRAGHIIGFVPAPVAVRGRKWDPWKAIVDERRTMLAVSTYDRILEFVQTGQRLPPGKLVKDFSVHFPVTSYVYAAMSLPFQWLLVSESVSLPFTMSDKAQDPRSKLPDLLRRSYNYDYEKGSLLDVQENEEGDLYRLAAYCTDVSIFRVLVKQKSYAQLVTRESYQSTFFDYYLTKFPRSLDRATVALEIIAMATADRKANNSRYSSTGDTADEEETYTSTRYFEDLLNYAAYLGPTVRQSGFFKRARAMAVEDKVLSDLALSQVYFRPESLDTRMKSWTDQAHALKVAALLQDSEAARIIVSQATKRSKVIYHALQPDTADLLVPDIDLRAFLDDFFTFWIYKKVLKRLVGDIPHRTGEKLQLLLDRKLPTKRPEWFQDIFSRYAASLNRLPEELRYSYGRVKDVIDMLGLLVEYGVRIDEESLSKIAPLLQNRNFEALVTRLNSLSDILIVVRVMLL